MGAASCWIGLIKVLMYLPKWRKKFGIKYPYKLNDCIAFGWPSPKRTACAARVQLVNGMTKELTMLRELKGRG